MIFKVPRISANEQKSIREECDRTSDLKNIEIMQIRQNPMQPRKSFDQAGIARLAESIKRYGLIHPLTVRPIANGGNYSYELISGERRLRAAALLGLCSVPCIIKPMSDAGSAEIAVIENLLRQDLNMFETAAALSRLLEEFNLTQEELASRLSMSQSAIANKLRLTRFSDAERNFIVSNGLTERHARTLLRISDANSRAAVMQFIAKNKLSVSSSEEYIDKLLTRTENEAQKAVGGNSLSKNPAGNPQSDPRGADYSSEETANSSSEPPSASNVGIITSYIKKAFKPIEKSMSFKSVSFKEAEDSITYTVVFDRKKAQ